MKPDKSTLIYTEFDKLQNKHMAKEPSKQQTTQLQMTEQPAPQQAEKPLPPKAEIPVATELPPVAEKDKAKTLTPIQKFNQYIENYKKGILPDLLKKHNISPEQFVHIVVSEVKKNEKLLNAFKENPASMFASILAGAEIGLIPSDMLGEFYLIPRYIDSKLTVTPLIGYKGIHNIILRSGEVTKVHTECVYEGDTFEPIYGLEPNIIHKPNFTTPRNANTLTFVYAVAKLKNGEYQFAVLSKSDVIKITQLSKYNNDLYFNDKKDPNMWMVRKTALMQLAKLLPKDYYGKKAIEMDGKLEGGAYLSLDEDNNVKMVDGIRITTDKKASPIKTFNSLPDIEELS